MIRAYSLWKDIIFSRYGKEGPWTTKEVNIPYGVGLGELLEISGQECGVILLLMWEMGEKPCSGMIYGWDKHL